jgi:hypothetical protein
LLFEGIEALVEGLVQGEGLKGAVGLGGVVSGGYGIGQAAEMGGGAGGVGEGCGGGALGGGLIAAVLAEEECGAGFGFDELGLESGVGGAEGLGLGGLICELSGEALGGALVGETALKGMTGEVVVAFLDGEFGFAAPLRLGFFVFLLLFEETVLVGDGDGDLGFDLEQLVLDVEEDLSGEFFGIFGAVEEVVEVGTEEGGDAF